MMITLLNSLIGVFGCLSCALVMFIQPQMRLSPASILTACWAASFIFVVLFGLSYEVSFRAVLTILGFVSANALGAAVASRVRLGRPSERESPDFDIQFHWGYSLFACAALVISAVLQLQTLGRGDFLTAEAAVEYTRARYAGDVSMLPHSSLSYGFATFVSAAGAITVATGRTKGWSAVLTLVLPVIGGGIFTATTTARLMTFAIIFSILSGLLAGFAVKRPGGASAAAMFKWTSGGILLFFVLVAMTIGVQSLRSGNRETLAKTADHLRPWIAGYIPGFSKWLDDHYHGPSVQPVPASHLLQGFSKLIGREDFVPDDSVLIGFPDGATSNALTSLRMWMSDFGEIGTALFFFLFGTMSTLAIYSVRSFPYLSTFVLVVMYQIAFWSVNNYPFGYGSQVLGVLLLGGYLAWHSQRRLVLIASDTPPI